MINIVVNTVIPPIIFTKFKSTLNCTVPKCAACHIASSMKINPGVIKRAIIPGK